MFNKRGKATSAIMAGLLAVGMAASPLAPAVAFATNSASAGSQTGSGQTDLTMILRDTDEHGGTAESQYLDDGTTPNPLYNPDADGDGLGDNIAFTVPSAINYVVDADGTMTGPTNASIQNRSVMGINVSSVDVDEESPFTIVSDATASSVDNSVDLEFGPAEDQLNAVDYLTKTDVADASKWEMGAEGAADANLGIETDGHVSHVAQDITQQSKFGTIKWYLKATQQQATVVQSWDVGAEPNTVTASLYDNGVLVVSGAGSMKDWNNGESPLWLDNHDVTSIVVEDGVSSIGQMAFAYCSSLTDVTIPSSVAIIMPSAFEGCVGLTSITIPSSVVSIGYGAFEGCSGLTTINCGFAEGTVADAPWGAGNATVNYNYAG